MGNLKQLMASNLKNQIAEIANLLTLTLSQATTVQRSNIPSSGAPLRPEIVPSYRQSMPNPRPKVNNNPTFTLNYTKGEDTKTNAHIIFTTTTTTRYFASCVRRYLCFQTTTKTARMITHRSNDVVENSATSDEYTSSL